MLWSWRTTMYVLQGREHVFDEEKKTEEKRRETTQENESTDTTTMIRSCCWHSQNQMNRWVRQNAFVCLDTHRLILQFTLHCWQISMMNYFNPLINESSMDKKFRLWKCSSLPWRKNQNVTESHWTWRWHWCRSVLGQINQWQIDESIIGDTIEMFHFVSNRCRLISHSISMPMNSLIC